MKSIKLFKVVLIFLLATITIKINLRGQCVTTFNGTVNLVSNNGNGTCTYNLSFTFSGWSNSMKSYEIIAVCSNTTIVNCTFIPNGATSISGTSSNFTCACSSSFTFTLNMGTSGATCGGGSTCTQSIPITILPVKWTALQVNLNANENAQINWSVYENEVSSYEIEKSSDGINFEKITSILSKGNGANNYSYTDLSTLYTITYYRIKQTDKNGRTTYSDILRIKNDTKLVSIYPNPTKEKFQITVDKSLLNTNLQLYNSSGILMQESKIAAISQTVILHNNIQTGVYYVKFATNKVEKLIVQ